MRRPAAATSRRTPAGFAAAAFAAAWLAASPALAQTDGAAVPDTIEVSPGTAGITPPRPEASSGEQPGGALLPGAVPDPARTIAADPGAGAPDAQGGDVAAGTTAAGPATGADGAAGGSASPASTAAAPSDGAATAATPPDPAAMPRDELVLVTASGLHRFTVEIADDPLERSRGLMFRTEMAEDHGMLFDFGTDGPRSFWMKNTPLSLDMIFAAADGTVVSVATNTVPYSLDAVPSEGDARFVLEVNAGVADRIGLAPGDRLLHRRTAR